MKKQTLLCGLFLGIGIGIGGLAATLAFHPPKPPHWENKLSLTGSDKNKVRQLFKEESKDMAPLKEKVNQSSHELKQVMKDPKASDNDIRAKFKEFNDARNELTIERFEMNLKVRQIVGPEKMHSFDESPKKASTPKPYPTPPEHL